MWVVLSSHVLKLPCTSINPAGECLLAFGDDQCEYDESAPCCRSSWRRQKHRSAIGRAALQVQALPLKLCGNLASSTFPSVLVLQTVQDPANPKPLCMIWTAWSSIWR